jgi:DNA-binding SARP family transcriptional activator
MIETRDGEVDLHCFRALAAAGRNAWYHGNADRAASALGEAVHLWRADLPDLPATPVLAPEAARLRAEFRDAQDMWMDARLALGQHHDAVAELRQILTREPLREHTWAQLMRALFRCGDKAGALAAFSAARAALAAGYGAGPGPELAEVRRQVLADSPALIWRGAAGEMWSQLPAQAGA